MTFTADDVARIKIIDIRTDVYNLAHELVANCHWNSNRLLCPIVPLVDMNIGAADARMVDANQHIIDTDGRFRNLFQPKSSFRFALDQRLHCLSSRHTRCTASCFADMRSCYLKNWTNCKHPLRGGSRNCSHQWSLCATTEPSFSTSLIPFRRLLN